MVTYAPVSPRKAYTFWIDEDLLEAIRRIKAEDGVNESEQIRRAIRKWVESRGGQKAERKRAVTRKRP